jgi:DNA polymerase-1
MNNILRQYQNAIKITEWNKQARQVLKKPQGVIACDTETTGLLFHTPSYLKDEERWVDNPFPFGLTLAFRRQGSMVLVWGRVGTQLYAECKKVLALPNLKVWHNMKYDRRVLKTNRIELAGPQHCTMTMSRIYWDRRQAHGLQELSEFICPEISGWEEELKEEKKRLQSHWTRTVKKEDIWLPDGVERNEYFNFSFLPDELMGKYSMVDGYMVYVLYERLYPQMQMYYEELYNRERQVVDVVIKIEEAGMGFDVERGRREVEEHERKIEKQHEILVKLGGQDFAETVEYSPKILRALRQLGVRDEQLKDKGKVTTGADVLRRCLSEGVPKFADRFIRALLSYRAYTKISGTYLKPLTAQAERTGGVVFTSINPTDSRTGRPASRDPNLLNIPKPVVKKQEEGNPVRECFVPRDGCAIYYFDVSQQEMAVFGLYADDQDILQAYERGEDIHQHMADQIGWSDKRDLVKNINFGVLYGMGITAMATMWGMRLAEAKKNMRIYMEAFPSVRRLQKECEMELKQRGYVEDFFGRRYHVQYGEAYKAVNALVQGGCAQAFKIGLLNVDSFLSSVDPQSKIILPVYDEIQIESITWRPKPERGFCRAITEQMTDIPQLLDRGLRLRVDVEKTVTNWAEKEKVEI